MSVCDEGGEVSRTKRTTFYVGNLNRTTTHYQHVASDILPKKRNLRKKVRGHKHANNPFLVYSIYFRKSHLKTFLVTEMDCLNREQPVEG